MSAKKFTKKKAKTGEKKLKPTRAVEKAAEKSKVKEEPVVPPGKLKICVIGPGAIGGLIAAYLKSKRRIVSVIGKPEHKRIIRSDGLKIESAKSTVLVELDIREEMWEKPDLVILAVRIPDIGKVLDKNRKFLEGSIVLTIQHGVKADQVVSLALGKENIISSIIMFGSTRLKPSLIKLDFEGDWIMGRPFGANDDKVKEIVEEFAPAFKITPVENITSMKWLKLIIETPYCIPAILGKTIPEAFADLTMAQLGVLLLKESLAAVEDAGIKPASLPNFDLDKLKQLIALPIKEAAQKFSETMTKMPKSNIDYLRDMDYINGEIVSLARFGRVGSMLNTRAVILAKKVKKTNTFLNSEDMTQAYNRELTPN
ncbi:ketopantoate reductase family protein [Candidatus Omnitrophota bacterium]